MVGLAVVLGASACGSSSAGRATAEDGGADAVTEITTATGDPVDGGQVVYALAAETSGFNPVTDRWGTSGTIVANAVYDPLAAFDAEGVARPYLAESIESNAEATSWTVTLREGVTFHDGTPLTAEDVVYLYEQHLASPLTKPVFASVETVEATGPRTVEFRLREPWATFPMALTSQVGVVPARSVLTDELGGLHPVGTGPFVTKSYEPDVAFVADRNTAYWQQGLPHLDRIEFRPIVDLNTRMAAFDAGDVQIIGDSDAEFAESYVDRCDRGECQLVVDRGESVETMILLNTAVPPFDNPTARRAVATALDRGAYIDAVAPGAQLADGPFAPGSRFYDEAAADLFPDHDPDAARALAEQYRDETGSDLSFVLTGTNEPRVRAAIQLAVEQLASVGIDAEVRLVESATGLLDAVTGNFEAIGWQQFGSPDPGMEEVWWLSTNASDPPSLALNMARNRNEAIDAALLDARRSDDPDLRAERYTDVVAELNTDLPYLWLYHSNWTYVTAPEVHGLANGPLPDGTPSMPFQSGVSRPTYLWVD